LKKPVSIPVVNNFERRASDYYGSWHNMDVRHHFRLVHVHFQTDSFGYSAEINEHRTEVLHGLSHDYHIIGKPKVSDVLAIYIDTSSFPVQKLKGILQCSGKQLWGDYISLSDFPLQLNRLRGLALFVVGRTWSMKRDIRHFNANSIEEAIVRNKGSKVFARDLSYRPKPTDKTENRRR
jgi:hypothetical protein